MSMKPPKMFEMVSFKPNEMTTEVTPSAVMNAVGLMPKTGSSTQMSAIDHTMTRTKFTMMDAAGRLSKLAIRRWMSLLRMCCTRNTSAAMMHRKSARMAMISGYRPKISIWPESSVEMKERLSISTLPRPCSISPIWCVPSCKTVVAND